MKNCYNIHKGMSFTVVLLLLLFNSVILIGFISNSKAEIDGQIIFENTTGYMEKTVSITNSYGYNSLIIEFEFENQIESVKINVNNIKVVILPVYNLSYCVIDINNNIIFNWTELASSVKSIEIGNVEVGIFQFFLTNVYIFALIFVSIIVFILLKNGSKEKYKKTEKKQILLKEGKSLF